MAKRKSAISKYLSKIGKKGGQKTGPTKARDPEKMSAASKKRWALAKEKEKKEDAAD
jgi:general stress protein YciG